MCLALLSITACNKTVDPGPALVVKSEISPLPAKVGAATVTLDLSDSSGKPVEGARIVLEAVMSHAGMAPVFGGSTEVMPGRYNGNLAFTPWLATGSSSCISSWQTERKSSGNWM